LKDEKAFVILIIEGHRGDHASFSEALISKDYCVTASPNGSSGLKILETLQPSLVVVDAASMRTSGVRICQSFRKADNDLPIILVIEKSVQVLEDVDADMVLRMPFTVQKLINRMRIFRPTDEKYILSVGPITLNTQTQLVSCHDQHTKLTPLLVDLLSILMNHQGEVVQRDQLFMEVWDTDYTVDTRTLDVHISWLRQAIEENARHPKLIKTIRGVGYLLDV
jgi:DNA-binding response OmpR family regulator